MPTIIGQDKSVYKTYTCSHCGGINQVKPNEIRNIYTGKDYSGGADGQDGFNCAQCGKVIVTHAW